MADNQQRDELRRGFTTEIIVQLVMLAVQALLASSISAAVTKWLANRFDSLSAYSWPIGVAFATVLFYVLFVFFRSRNRRRPVYRKLACDAEMRSKEIEYRYTSRKTLLYTKQMRIAALRNGVDRYVDKYYWSGEGTVLLTSMVNEHTLRHVGHRNVWQLYEIQFPWPLAKGEEIDVGVKWEMTVTGRTPAPFFSQTVVEPTERLLFKLRLPEDFGITKVVKSVLPSIESLRPIESAEGVLTDGTFTWEISRPSLMHCYQVHWHDPEYAAPPTQGVIEPGGDTGGSTS